MKQLSIFDSTIEFNSLAIANIGLISVLALVLIYIGLNIYRTIRRSRNESSNHRLRMTAFEQQALTASLRHEISQKKTQNRWNGSRKFRVDEIVPEAKDISSYYLVPHDGEELPAFEPGQYLTFKLRIPGNQATVTRCYSLSESPFKLDRYRVSIKKLQAPKDQPDTPDGLSSGYFHDQLNKGDILDCKAPGGKFYLDMAERTPIVLIGGGIGITPMLSMLRSIVLSKSSREVWLFYGARTHEELVQYEYLKQLDAEYENIRVKICLSSPLNSDDSHTPFDHKGRITVNYLEEQLPSLNYEYFICGPASMMASLTQGLAEKGVQKDHINFESFGPASVNRIKQESTLSADTKHLIKFSKSNQEYSWTKSDGSLLDFAEANGLNMESGCRAGSCGTCSIALLKGSIEYLDTIEAEPESGSCLACMAIPQGPLVIDA